MCKVDFKCIESTVVLGEGSNETISLSMTHEFFNDMIAEASNKMEGVSCVGVEGMPLRMMWDDTTSSSVSYSIEESFVLALGCLLEDEVYVPYASLIDCDILQHDVIFTVSSLLQSIAVEEKYLSFYKFVYEKTDSDISIVERYTKLKESAECFEEDDEIDLTEEVEDLTVPDEPIMEDLLKITIPVEAYNCGFIDYFENSNFTMVCFEGVRFNVLLKSGARFSDQYDIIEYNVKMVINRVLRNSPMDICNISVIDINCSDRTFDIAFTDTGMSIAQKIEINNKIQKWINKEEKQDMQNIIVNTIGQEIGRKWGDILQFIIPISTYNTICEKCMPDTIETLIPDMVKVDKTVDGDNVEERIENTCELIIEKLIGEDAFMVYEPFFTVTEISTDNIKIIFDAYAAPSQIKRDHMLSVMCEKVIACDFMVATDGVFELLDMVKDDYEEINLEETSHEEIEEVQNGGEGKIMEQLTNVFDEIIKVAEMNVGMEVAVDNITIDGEEETTKGERTTKTKFSISIGNISIKMNVDANAK